MTYPGRAKLALPGMQRRGGRGGKRWHPGAAAPQKGREPRSPAVVHSWQVLAAGRPPAMPCIARGIALPDAPPKPGCPAPAGCIPISLPGTFACRVLLHLTGMWP